MNRSVADTEADDCAAVARPEAPELGWWSTMRQWPPTFTQAASRGNRAAVLLLAQVRIGLDRDVEVTTVVAAVQAMNLDGKDDRQRVPAPRNVEMLYRDNRRVDFPAAIGNDWALSVEAMADQHAITYNAGIVDQRNLHRVPTSPLCVGQRITVANAKVTVLLDAALALDPLLRVACNFPLTLPLGIARGHQGGPQPGLLVSLRGETAAHAPEPLGPGADQLHRLASPR